MSGLNDRFLRHVRKALKHDFVDAEWDIEHFTDDDSSEWEEYVIHADLGGIYASVTFEIRDGHMSDPNLSVSFDGIPNAKIGATVQSFAEGVRRLEKMLRR